MSEYTFQLTELSPVEQDIKVTVPEAVMVKKLDDLYAELSQTASVKGFRKGKIPKTVVIKMFKKKAISEVISEVEQQAFQEAAQEHNLRPITISKMNRSEYKDGDYSYSFVLEVMPKIEDVNLDGIEVEREKVVVSDEAIEKGLDRMREDHADFKSLDDKKVVEGEDWIRIDIMAELDGEEFNPAGDSNKEINLGDPNMVPEFKENIVGQKKGEEFIFSVDYPEDYFAEQFRNKTVSYKCTVSDIVERVLPELDDEFAKDMGEFENLNELRIKLREEAEKGEKNRINQMFKSMLWQKIVDANEVPLPPSMIEDQTAKEITRSFEEMAKQGASLEKLGLTEEDHNKRIRNDVIMTLRTVFIQDVIAEQNGIEVTEEEMDQKFEELAAEMNMPVENIKGFYNDSQHGDSMRYSIRQEKIVNFLEDKINIIETEPKTSEEAEIKE